MAPRADAVDIVRVAKLPATSAVIGRTRSPIFGCRDGSLGERWVVRGEAVPDGGVLALVYRVDVLSSRGRSRA